MMYKMKPPRSRLMNIEYTYENKNGDTVTLHFDGKSVGIDDAEIIVSLTDEEIKRIEEIMPLDEVCINV